MTPASLAAWRSNLSQPAPKQEISWREGAWVKLAFTNEVAVAMAIVAEATRDGSSEEDVERCFSKV